MVERDSHPFTLSGFTLHAFICTSPQVISTARTCDLIFIVLDCLKPLTHKRIIERELEGFGIRLNKKAPNITFKWVWGWGVWVRCVGGGIRDPAEQVSAKHHV